MQYLGINFSLFKNIFNGETKLLLKSFSNKLWELLVSVIFG